MILRSPELFVELHHIDYIFLNLGEVFDPKDGIKIVDIQNAAILWEHAAARLVTPLGCELFQSILVMEFRLLADILELAQMFDDHFHVSVDLHVEHIVRHPNKNVRIRLLLPILTKLFLLQNVVRIALIAKPHVNFSGGAVVLRPIRHIIGIIQMQQHLVFILVCAGFVHYDGRVGLDLPILGNSARVSRAQNK